MSTTLATHQDQTLFQPRQVLPVDTTQVTDPRNGSNPQWGDPCHSICAQGHAPSVCIRFKGGQGAKAASIGCQDEVSPTLTAAAGGSNQSPCICIQGTIANGKRMGQNGEGISEDGSCYTLDTIDVPAICMSGSHVRSAVDVDLAGTLLSSNDRHTPTVCFPWNAAGKAIGSGCACELAPTLRAASSGEPAVAFNPRNGTMDCELSGTLQAGGDSYSLNAQNPIIAPDYIVRRLTPAECERLQGFPDGWTDIYPDKVRTLTEEDWTGAPDPFDDLQAFKEYVPVKRKAKVVGTPDAPRYKALGNSMAVPVMEWVGRRIREVA